MADWDGRGLPPAAAARMARFGASGLRTSLMSVPSAVGAESVGLDAVGEVLGCIVEHVGWQGWGGWGYSWSGWGVGAGTGRVGSSLAGYGPYVDALYRGYHTALSRMSAEAVAMSADGVLGVSLTASRLDNDNIEFVALGTAVRARSTQRPAYLFTTGLAGQDVAKLMLAGWMPVSVALGISVAIRHDDWATRQAAGTFAGNVEIPGYTELVTRVRREARARFGERASAAGADGAIVSRMYQLVWAIEPSENHVDHVAESVIMGSALVRFGGDAPRTDSLVVLPLRRF